MLFSPQINLRDALKINLLAQHSLFLFFFQKYNHCKLVYEQPMLVYDPGEEVQVKVAFNTQSCYWKSVDLEDPEVCFIIICLHEHKLASRGTILHSASAGAVAALM